jgi:AmpD protein
MQLSDDGAWLLGAQRIPSPNCDERPEGCEVSLIVVHGISLPPGQYGGPWIDNLFTNRLDPHAHPYFPSVCASRVSAHVLVRRNGELVQYVSFHRRAWHAGPSRYRSQEACNDFAIGIELEGQDHESYEPIQYQRLATLVNLLRKRFPAIGPGDIVGHSDIAPGRKTDPGPAFDWARLHALLA